MNKDKVIRFIIKLSLGTLMNIYLLKFVGLFVLLMLDLLMFYIVDKCCGGTNEK